MHLAPQMQPHQYSRASTTKKISGSMLDLEDRAHCQLYLRIITRKFDIENDSKPRRKRRLID